MINKLTLMVGMLVLITLQGCVMPRTPFKAEQIKTDEAVVYLYRPESFISRGLHFSAIINDNKTVTPLINNAYIPIHVKAGAFKLKLQKNGFPKSTLDTITYDNLEAGKAYYLKAKPGLFGAYTLVKMSDTEGLAEISSTSYYQPQ